MKSDVPLQMNGPEQREGPVKKDVESDVPVQSGVPVQRDGPV